MVTLALAMHTTDEEFHTLPGGHAYLVLSEPTITVEDLLHEKVRAEFRKARALDGSAASLEALSGFTHVPSHPSAEQATVNTVINRFIEGEVHLYVDGKRVYFPDDTIHLTRRTGLHVVVPSRKVHDDTNTSAPDTPAPDVTHGSARRR
jgi:hypothetical protein